MKIGGNVSGLNVVGDINHQTKDGVGDSTIIAHEKEGGAELLKNTLDALARGLGDVKKNQNQPEVTLSPQQIAEKSKLEENGLSVTVRPDGKFIVEAEEDKNVFLSSDNIKNVAVLKGNFEVYNGTPQSDVEYSNLETVDGNIIISGFNDECRTAGPNWGYACDVKFPNLKQVTGDFHIQSSACQMYLDSLKEVGGTLNIADGCETDNVVNIPNIQHIGGDFNIQGGGTVITSPQIFMAVDGTMNAVPPKSKFTNGFGSTLQVGEGDKAKYYEFTTQEGVIKKYNI